MRGSEAGVSTIFFAILFAVSPLYGSEQREDAVIIPGGEFMMGSGKDDISWVLDKWPDVEKQWYEDEKPKHSVKIDLFTIDRHEVTNRRFDRFVKATEHKTDAEKENWAWVYDFKKREWARNFGASWRRPHGRGSDISGLEEHPVVQVSWNDAKAFCEWDGKRLPTEAEWEYAARGGSEGRYPWGDDKPTGKDANFADRKIRILKWADRKINDGYKFTAPAGSYPPNGFGVYDMAGNVWEWVNDWYDENYYKKSPVKNPLGPPSPVKTEWCGECRVLRGGGWSNTPKHLRIGYRHFSSPKARSSTLGFRCAR